MRTLSFDENQALDLYHQGKNDREIGEAVGTLRNAIYLWRKSKDLPAITRIRKKPNRKPGVSYFKVLTPHQAAEMERFLRALSWAATRAIESGVKPDVNSFINLWSGRGKDAEDRKFKHKMLMRKSRSKKKIS